MRPVLQDRPADAPAELVAAVVLLGERAAALGLSGWIRNVANGDVEAVFEGTEAAVEQIVRWCGEGPPLARVDRIDVVDDTPTNESGFRVD